MTERLPTLSDMDEVRQWLAGRRPDVDAVRAWTERLLADLAPVPVLGSDGWLTLGDRDPRELAAATRPALTYLMENTPEAIADRLRAELDRFATAWRRAHKEASRTYPAPGPISGTASAPRTQTWFVATSAPCGACGAAVTVVHPVPDEYAVRLPDMSWVRCSDCPQSARPATVWRRDAA